MAYVLQSTSSNRNVISTLLPRLRDAIARRRTYTRVLRELSSMSTRELTDINLTRGDIRRVARESAQL
ncbi:MAG: DUF1127 domain-containing protein [Pseudomonadota bacterium]